MNEKYIQYLFAKVSFWTSIIYANLNYPIATISCAGCHVMTQKNGYAD